MINHQTDSHEGGPRGPPSSRVPPVLSERFSETTAPAKTSPSTSSHAKRRHLTPGAPATIGAGRERLDADRPRAAAHGRALRRLPPDPVPDPQRHRSGHAQRRPHPAHRARHRRQRRAPPPASRAQLAGNRRPPQPLLRVRPLPCHRRVHRMGPRAPPRGLLADPCLVHHRHGCRLGHPRRLPARPAPHAHRRGLRRHPPHLRTQHLPHRHHTVGRQPVCGDAVAALRLGRARRRRCTGRAPPPPQQPHLAPPRHHAHRHRGNRQPLPPRRPRRAPPRGPYHLPVSRRYNSTTCHSQTRKEPA